MKALQVTQMGKANCTFIVKNPKKFKFWERMAEMDGGMAVKTIVKKINIPDKNGRK